MMNEDAINILLSFNFYSCFTFFVYGKEYIYREIQEYYKKMKQK